MTVESLKARSRLNSLVEDLLEEVHLGIKAGTHPLQTLRDFESLHRLHRDKNWQHLVEAVYEKQHPKLFTGNPDLLELVRILSTSNSMGREIELLREKRSFLSEIRRKSEMVKTPVAMQVWTLTGLYILLSVYLYSSHMLFANEFLFLSLSLLLTGLLIFLRLGGQVKWKC